MQKLLNNELKTKPRSTKSLKNKDSMTLAKQWLTAFSNKHQEPEEVFIKWMYR